MEIYSRDVARIEQFLGERGCRGFVAGLDASPICAPAIVILAPGESPGRASQRRSPFMPDGLRGLMTALCGTGTEPRLAFGRTSALPATMDSIKTAAPKPTLF